MSNQDETKAREAIVMTRDRFEPFLKYERGQIAYFVRLSVADKHSIDIDSSTIEEIKEHAEFSAHLGSE